MITKFTQSLLCFMLVWGCYRIPAFFFEGYHDFAKRAGEAPSKYILDLVSPIWFVPEIVAVSLAVYVWKSHDGKVDIVRSIFQLFGSVFLYIVLDILTKIGKFGLVLDGARESNLFHYVGTIIAILVGSAPWIYWCFRKKNKKASE